MKKYIKYVVLIPVVVIAIIFSCDKKDKNGPKSDTILEGNASILVDETLLPIVEDQTLVFQNQYNAKIELLPKSEREAVLDFSKDKAGIIVLARELNKKEIAVFNQKKIKPRTTPFAIDAITFIRNKKSNDTLIALNDVINFLKGTKNNIKGLVFDNPNSSTASYLCKLAGIETLPNEGVFSYKTNDEVIKYVSQNDGMIGVVGINWISQPKPNMEEYINKVNVLSVKGADNKYVKPTQEAIGTREYPLARVLYIINCQGYEGLGMGFASFIAGEIGQRIILQSGLSPMREPSRNIRIRNQIEKK